MQLLRTHLASNLREHVVGVAADQANGANHDHQNYREHDRVFGDVLATFIGPKLMNCFNHFFAPSSDDAPEAFYPSAQ